MFRNSNEPTGNRLGRARLCVLTPTTTPPLHRSCRGIAPWCIEETCLTKLMVLRLDMWAMVCQCRVQVPRKAMFTSPLDLTQHAHLTGSHHKITTKGHNSGELSKGTETVCLLNYSTNNTFHMIDFIFHSIEWKTHIKRFVGLYL